MKSFISTCCAVLLVMALTLSASAQNYQQLRDAILKQQAETRAEINSINDLIDRYERQLNQAEQRYEEVYKQYENLQRLLALQEQKITSLRKERRQINEEISVTENKITNQENKLEQLIEDYKSAMRYLYKNGRTSQLALILSSESVNQMMVRNYYLKEFETYRENQAEEIRQTKQELSDTRQELDDAAARNDEVMAEIQKEEKELQQKTRQQEATVKILRQDIEQIKEQRAREQQNREEFQQALAQSEAREQEIRQKIREEQQAEARRQAQAAADNEETSDLGSNTEPAPAEPVAAEETEEAIPSSANSNTRYVGEVGYLSDSELSAISSDFASLKGQLPWPVESSTISERFGQRRHPVYGTVTPNLGVEIVTQSQQEVHVVHDGYVFNVQPLTGYGDVVFVSHGDYITAYGNLSRVSVRKNTILEKGDLIGYSGDQNSTRGESVFFMLRSGSQNVDPEDWLRNK